jgi:hypothetical protein
MVPVTAARRPETSSADANTTAAAGAPKKEDNSAWPSDSLAATGCPVRWNTGALEPIVESWWQRFPRPFLYYTGRRLVASPLRAFIDFFKTSG